jgi:superfamily II DNA or RNA helicase
MQVAAHHLKQRERTTVVWLATTEELCEQAAAEFAKTWEYAGDRDVSLVRAWGSYSIDQAQLTAPEPKFLVAGLAKLHAAKVANQALLPKLGDLVSLVIFDEAHQSVADTYRKIVNVLVARRTDTRLLGLSATPGRTWGDVTADSELSTYFGKSKVALEIPGYLSPITYLIDQGYLARPVFRRVDHHAAGGLSPTEIRNLAEALDVPEELRTRLAEDDLRNLSIVRECQRLLKVHKRLLVFAATVAHADLIAVVLQGLGIAAQSVTGKSAASERSRYINWYRASDPEPRALVNYGILATGFDAPNTSAALIARPTKSLVLYSQMVGRAMRGIRAGGNQQAEIVTVVDTSLPGFGDPAAAFSNWEDVW